MLVPARKSSSCLCACFPAVLVFTVPMATLIGVLLGLGRMSADSEIIALTALGIGRRRILLPVGVLALTGAVVTLAMTLWLSPLALRTFRAIEAELITSQISFAGAAARFRRTLSAGWFCTSTMSRPAARNGTACFLRRPAERADRA